MNTSHKYSKAYVSALRRMNRPSSSDQASRNASIPNQQDAEPVKTQQYAQEQTIKNFIDSQEHELMSTGYNMNGSRVYLASSHNFKQDPEKYKSFNQSQRPSSVSRVSYNRCNTDGVDPLEANKGFYCVNYRSRTRFTNIGSSRKRALSSANVAQSTNIEQNKSQERMSQTNTSFSPMKQSGYYSTMPHPMSRSMNESRLLNELKMNGSRIFKQQVGQFRRRPLQQGQSEPVWDLNDEEMNQRLKELSQPKQILMRNFPVCIVGGNKIMNLQDPKSKEFIQRLSEPKKYIPWPQSSQTDKIFKCNDTNQLEYLNKISLPRRMADFGHKKNFRYNFCNCTNGDDYADEGRNMQGTQSSNGYFKLQSFFYQNSKAQDDGLFYPKNLN
ncbi:hypothetical protein TTHERM_00039250 (macronuclear) [Tetrahymena thermophila SB210]|uniref:Uncharacterized protein n=1 Tax=Tetrahymena thermophila (strain SB210) TaxID=312017 RepID=Q22LZ4_TETTS|nr:hypothetical protein TTHERM_00039250 [Tetrahymena thermophila SB210]EAR86272.1 hypothetical protein TTHERM_00039250 [Tetrahymena thermophila SB210]|eukprot:XP_977226.1 hypothetical protein TTHERM_00039250 [Tetrahymena thermophila SB210]